MQLATQQFKKGDANFDVQIIAADLPRATSWGPDIGVRQMSTETSAQAPLQIFQQGQLLLVDPQFPGFSMCRGRKPVETYVFIQIHKEMNKLSINIVHLYTHICIVYIYLSLSACVHVYTHICIISLSLSLHVCMYTCSVDTINNIWVHVVVLPAGEKWWMMMKNVHTSP